MIRGAAARALCALWPVDSGLRYSPRVPLWGQPWSWSREWLAEAGRHNTAPAMLVRAAAVVVGQALVIGAGAVAGVLLASLLLWWEGSAW